MYQSFCFLIRFSLKELNRSQNQDRFIF